MTVCSSLARGRAMRLTRLDECGNVVEGPTSTLVTKGYVSVTSTPVYTEPEDITQTDANGDNCIDDQSDPALRWVTLAMVFVIWRIRVLAALLLYPYLGWLILAGALNYQILMLNPHAATLSPRPASTDIPL